MTYDLRLSRRTPSKSPFLSYHARGQVRFGLRYAAALDRLRRCAHGQSRSSERTDYRNFALFLRVQIVFQCSCT